MEVGDRKSLVEHVLIVNNGPDENLLASRSTEPEETGVEETRAETEVEVAGMFEENVVISGGNEVIGGEAEYAINDLLINYDIINKEFLSRKEELSQLDNYDEIRKKYLDKLMALFSLNAKTIKEFDQELQEIYIMDDISLFYILFKRFRIKEISINKIVNELNEKLNKKYFNNKIKLDKEYPLQQFSRLFKNIPKDNFVLPKFDKYEKINLDIEYSDKKLDSSCKTCIYNRIYFLVDYLNKKLISLKDKFITPQFLTNIPPECYIGLTIANPSAENIYGKVPAIVPLSFPLN
jgi:hypothetical protein